MPRRWTMRSTARRIATACARKSAGADQVAAHARRARVFERAA
jgi:hypothetical protein